LINIFNRLRWWRRAAQARRSAQDTTPGLHMGTVSGGPEGVDWLIAKRAAEIVGTA